MEIGGGGLTALVFTQVWGIPSMSSESNSNPGIVDYDTKITVTKTERIWFTVPDDASKYFAKSRSGNRERIYIKSNVMYLNFENIEIDRVSDSNRTSNDQKSDVKNPTSSEYKAAADNHSNQMNPNNPAFAESRKN